MIKIINTATLSSFQDLGRFGKKSIGVSQSGCLDKFSFLISNFLCGNKKNEGAIEIVGGGFSCKFKEDVSIAVSGPTGIFMINNNQFLESTITVQDFFLDIGLHSIILTLSPSLYSFFSSCA